MPPPLPPSPEAPTSREAFAGALLFGATSFWGAALLFGVEPLFAKTLLPVLGGTPAVWNTCLAFYQVVLTAGYVLAHGVSSSSFRRQAVVYGALLSAASLVLFTRFSPGVLAGPPSPSPILWLIGRLALSAGFPFLSLSLAGPLLQKWFSRSGRDPYFLYGWGNLGSLAGLLSYPLWIERFWRLADQFVRWRAGYLLWVLLLSLCAFTRGRRGKAAAPSAAGRIAPWDVKESALWVLLSALPSALMLGTTTYLCTDVSPVPLFWVVPLALYLLTWIISFSPRMASFRRAAVKGMPLAALLTGIFIATSAMRPLGLVVAIHLTGLFLVSLALHGKLADLRPPPERLTVFYLCLSVGGALGGAFNAWAAPLLFNRVAEYPIALVGACLMMGGNRDRAGRAMDVFLPAALALFLAACVHWGGGFVMPFFDGILVLAGMAVYPASRRPWRFGAGMAVLLAAGSLAPDEAGRTVFAQRSFFGVSRVTEDRGGGMRWLIHGNTVHGGQRLDPALRRKPVTYYHPHGPLGGIFSVWRGRRVAAVGLGVGEAVSYARPDQRWTFYEVDPLVEKIARDPRYFTFLSDSPCPVDVVLGDARISLAKAEDRAFDLILMDAFGSASVPVHLLTREAVALYKRKLAMGGLIAFHVSNKYLDLVPVLAGDARETGLAGLVWRDDAVSPEDAADGKLPSTWVVLGSPSGFLDRLKADPRWRPLEGSSRSLVWSDDFSDLLSVMSWGEGRKSPS